MFYVLAATRCPISLAYVALNCFLLMKVITYNIYQELGESALKHLNMRTVPTALSGAYCRSHAELTGVHNAINGRCYNFLQRSRSIILSL